MRTTLPTRMIEADRPAVTAAPQTPAGNIGRVSVQERAGGGVVLRVRANLPPAQVVGHVLFAALVVTFALAAVGAVVIFSVVWVRSDFDFAGTFDNLPKFGAVPPHVFLTATAVSLLLTAFAVTGGWMMLYGLFLTPAHLEVTRDGWLVRRGRRPRSGELWRERIDQVQSVDYGPASVIVRLADGRPRMIRGWDADMAWLAVSLRWALESVARSADVVVRASRLPM